MSGKIVSFDDEKLILVDENDNEIGYESKDVCHNGDGILHRAFSIFIFNSKHELLIQQRDASKRLWGGYWSNTCCSHPRKGESYAIATKRRLDEEIGLKTPLQYLFRFQYQAKFEDKGSENELCSVYIGHSDQTPVINETEIMDWKYISITELNRDLMLNPQNYTPWFKMEWERMTKEYMDAVLNP
jgi:isopentenyl-diphosphate delta-isomerase